MLSSRDKKEISDLIEDDYILKAIDVYLGKIDSNRDGEKYNDLVLLKSQMNSHLKEHGLGLNNTKFDKNRISKELLRRLSEEKITDKTKIDASNKLFLLVVALFVVGAYLSNLEESNKINDLNSTEVRRLANSLGKKNINDSIEVETDEIFVPLKSSDSLICSHLKCTKEDSELFISELDRYLYGFWSDYELGTRSNSPIKYIKKVCGDYLSSNSLVQIMNADNIIKTYHADNFCDTTSTKEIYQGLKFIQIKPTIESIFIGKQRYKKYNVGIADKRVIRFILRSNNTSDVKCYDKCFRYLLDYIVVIKAIEETDYVYTFEVEGVLINNVVRQLKS